MHEVLYTREGLRALTERDVAAVYRMLVAAGVRQQQIAEMVGQSQSEVSEIMSGRQVMGYDLLVRICEGLDVPRGLMGLAYDEDVPTDDTMGEVDEDVKRRALLAKGSIALFGAPLLGEVLHIPTRPDTPTPLPSRLGAADVTAMKNLTHELRMVSRSYGGCGEVLSGVAERSLQLMSVSAPDEVHADLASALAGLHTLAGWSCVDSGLHDNARAHFARALELAVIGANGYQVGSALHHMGIHMRDDEAYNDDLKACQLGLIKLADFPDSPEIYEMTSWLHAESALAYAAMGKRKEADREIKIAREYQMTNPFDDADMDYRTSCVYRKLGRVGPAEAIAASSVRKWTAEGHARRDSVLSDIALATIHTQAGDTSSARLAHTAISNVASLRSGRARAALTPLVEALQARSDSTSRDLAYHARKLQST